MTRNISAAAMAVALLAMTTPAVAQVRIRHDGGQPSHGAARMRVPPPTQSAPTRTDQAHPTTPPAAATFKFDPHRHDQRVFVDFSGYYQHLELVAGPHLITIIAPNYEPLIIEAMVPPGRTITHRGTLTRAYGR